MYHSHVRKPPGPWPLSIRAWMWTGYGHGTNLICWTRRPVIWTLLRYRQPRRILSSNFSPRSTRWWLQCWRARRLWEHQNNSPHLPHTQRLTFQCSLTRFRKYLWTKWSSLSKAWPLCWQYVRMDPESPNIIYYLLIFWTTVGILNRIIRTIKSQLNNFLLQYFLIIFDSSLNGSSMRGYIIRDINLIRSLEIETERTKFCPQTVLKSKLILVIYLIIVISCYLSQLSQL